MRDPRLPGCAGRYVFGDFCRGRDRVGAPRRRAARAPCARRACASARCPRSARTRAGASTPSRSTGPVYRFVRESEHLDGSTSRSSARTNPSPMTLSGTNTWVVGRDPAWVVDPGPALPTHIDAVAAAVEARRRRGRDRAHPRPRRPRGGRAGPARAARRPPVAAMRYPADVALGDGDVFGPFTALHLPGHAPDHLVLVSRATPASRATRCSARAACSSPRTAAGSPPTSTASAACARSASPVSTRGTARDRRRRGAARRVRRAPAGAGGAAAGRARGGRADEDALLDAAWADAPAALRPVAALTLRAHLAKLRDDERLPEGVEIGG